MCYVALISAETNLVVFFAAETIAINVLIEKFLALSAVDYLTHDCTPFHSRFNVFGSILKIGFDICTVH